MKRTARLWMVALATLVFVPVALADHDDWDDDYYDDDYSNDSYYDDDDDYGYDDDWRGGRDYDRYGSSPELCRSPYEIGRFDTLQGHGRWLWMSRVNSYLWFPYVETSWRPYLYGHWVHSPLGMTWVSYEPWGEVPHHYGSWVWVDHYGWGWVPGYEYSPARVTWGVVDGYVGWAPLLPPAGYRYPHYRDHYRYHHDRHYGSHYGFSGSFGYHSSGLDFGLWVFVSNDHFYGRSVYTHAVPTRHTLSLFKSKKVVPVGHNLHVDYVKRISKDKVRTVKLDRRTKSVGGREITFHEPRGQSDKVRSGRDFVSKKVVNRTRSDDVDRRELRVRTPDSDRNEKDILKRPPVRVSPERSTKTRETVIVQKSEDGRKSSRVEKTRSAPDRDRESPKVEKRRSSDVKVEKRSDPSPKVEKQSHPDAKVEKRKSSDAKVEKRDSSSSKVEKSRGDSSSRSTRESKPVVTKRKK